MATKTPVLASRWSRLFAIIIDGIIIGVINGVLFGSGMDYEDGSGGLISLVGALYVILFWLKWNGQTPGKKILGIKVIKEDGSMLDTKTAIFRYIGYLVSGLVLMLGYIWILFDPKRQGWHDKIAGTLVVNEK